MQFPVAFTALTLVFCWFLAGDILAASPSFDCQGVALGGIEELVCNDDQLAALDRKLADVYAAAHAIAVNEHPPTLRRFPLVTTW